MDHDNRNDEAGLEQRTGAEAPPPGVRLASLIRWLMLAVALIGAGTTATLALLPNGPAVESRYHCPMHPTVVSDGPSDCPICGMDLVPVLEEPKAEAGSVPGLTGVQIPAEKLERIGLRTATVESGRLDGVVRTVGVVAADERNRAVVQTRFSGWVEKLLVDETGVQVKKGQPLVRIYGPELYRSQIEYVNSIEYGGELLRPVAERLRLLGVSDAELATLKKTRTAERAMLLRAPVGGHVLHKGVVAGSYVGPGTILFEIADLSRVWVLADVYEQDLARVQPGSEATFVAAALGDQRFACKVAMVYPTVEPATRTTKVRLELENPMLALLPGMFGDVRIETPGAEGPIVPRDAVIETGEHVYVLVARDGGNFEPREVRILSREGERMVVEGVQPGERVVTSAAFFVDAEARIRAALERLP